MVPPPRAALERVIKGRLQEEADVAVRMHPFCTLTARSNLMYWARTDAFVQLELF